MRTNIGTVLQVTVFIAPFFQYAVSLETGRGVPKLIERNGQEVPAKQQIGSFSNGDGNGKENVTWK